MPGAYTLKSFIYKMVYHTLGSFGAAGWLDRHDAETPRRLRQGLPPSLKLQRDKPPWRVELRMSKIRHLDGFVSQDDGAAVRADCPSDSPTA